MIYNKKRFIYVRKLLSAIYKKHSVNVNENHCHMFINDLKSFVAPYSNYTNYGYLAIEFVGSEEDITKTVKLLEVITGKKYRESAGLVGDVMRKFTSDLLYNNGVKYYKYSFDDEFFFQSIDGINIFEFLNVAVMVVPVYSDLIKRQHGKHKAYESIEHVLKLSIPKECGGGMSVRDFIINLSACKDMPHHVMDLFGGNYIQYSNVKNLEILKITKGWGWNMRGLVNDNLSDTYKYYRKINFILSLIKLRTYLLQELNLFIASMNLDAEIKLKERYESSFLQDLKHKIDKGTILNSELKTILGPN